MKPPEPYKKPQPTQTAQTQRPYDFTKTKRQSRTQDRHAPTTFVIADSDDYAVLVENARPIKLSDEITPQDELTALLERDRKIINLRKSGLTYDQIGTIVNLAASSVRTVIQTALKAYADSCEDDIVEIRVLERLRLDALTAAAWPASMQGEIEAINTQLKIMARRAKMEGLDAPVQTETNLHGNVNHTGAIGIYPTKEAQAKEMEALRNVYDSRNAPALESLNAILAQLAGPAEPDQSAESDTESERSDYEASGVFSVQALKSDLEAIPAPAADL